MPFNLGWSMNNTKQKEILLTKKLNKDPIDLE